MNKIESQSALKFVLAGKSLFTIRNETTGNRFTYKVTDLRRIDPRAEKEIYFVKVLTGADNTNDYRFIGSVQKNGHLFYKHSNKAKITEEAQSVKAFKWFLGIAQKEIPEFIGVYHEGRCGRCGKTLTVPESIEAGFGPECITKL